MTRISRATLYVRTSRGSIRDISSDSTRSTRTKYLHSNFIKLFCRDLITMVWSILTGMIRSDAEIRIYILTDSRNFAGFNFNFKVAAKFSVYILIFRNFYLLQRKPNLDLYGDCTVSPTRPLCFRYFSAAPSGHLALAPSTRQRSLGSIHVPASICQHLRGSSID